MNKIEAEQKIEKYLEFKYNSFKDQVMELTYDAEKNISIINFLSKCYDNEDSACELLKSYCHEEPTKIVSRFFGLKKELVYNEFTESGFKEFYNRNYSGLYLEKDHPLSEEGARSRGSEINERYQRSLSIIKKIV
jgi:hypothetical protein